jgi:hypothetical protein
VKYTVRYQITNNADGGYAVEYTPLDRGSYQQGLIGKYPVPEFSDADLRNHLLDNGIAYKFEINTDYPPEHKREHCGRVWLKDGGAELKLPLGHCLKTWIHYSRATAMGQHHSTPRACVQRILPSPARFLTIPFCATPATRVRSRIFEKLVDRKTIVSILTKR